MRLYIEKISVSADIVLFVNEVLYALQTNTITVKLRAFINNKIGKRMKIMLLFYDNNTNVVKICALK
jgi:hypothetical protein